MTAASLNSIVRTIQGLHAVVVLGLSSAVAHWYIAVADAPTPPQLNFLFFASVWSLFSIASIEAILPRFLPRTIPKAYITAPFEVTNAVFWFVGFVALARFLSSLFFCRGEVCHAAQADVAFAASSFAIWAASLVLTGRELIRLRRGAAARPTGAIPPMAKEGP